MWKFTFFYFIVLVGAITQRKLWDNVSAGAPLCKIEDLGQSTLYTHMLRQDEFILIKTGKMMPKIYKFQADNMP